MKIIYPFIFTSNETLVNQAAGFDNTNGVTYKALSGVHAIWAARVPFLPAMLSDDLTRVGNDRIGLVQKRQFRFIYDLTRIRENHSTFNLRFISTPNPTPGQPNLIDMIYLAKVFGKNQQHALILAEKLWEKFYSLFPIEEPFGYPIEPVTNKEEFLFFYEPIKFQSLTSENVLEIRKYEEMPIRPMTALAPKERVGDYIVHPFVPSQTSNPMSRFFASLASQPEKSYVDVSLRPTKMFDQEIYNVSFMIGMFKKTANEDQDVLEEYIRKRAQIGVYVYESLMIEREQLQMVRVHLVGETSAPRSLAEALGSEMMGNAANIYPTTWVASQPANEEQFQTELNNIRFLEHDFWGHTIAAPPLQRLRYFCTEQEAYGAFRLPIPPESGYIPGTLVRNEPFISPIDELELREQTRANKDDVLALQKNIVKIPGIKLGQIYHRGTATSEDFSIPIPDLTRHALIAGSTGSGKSTTIKHILSQLWNDHGLPFMVLYPVDKPDYRELLGFEGLYDDLLIFTVGDESTSPFRFNPFEVQPGVLIKTHISRMMGIFESAFSLQEPLPMVYREALRKVYRDKGWDIALDRGSEAHEYPILSEFFDAISFITDNLKYGREVGDNIRQASVIRIGDLLENVGNTLNVRKSMPFNLILKQPTIMELGRIGSTDDIALMMGFLLISFAEALEVDPRPKSKPHITIVEEAHRLMSEVGSGSDGSGNSRGGAGETFSNLLAEVRGFGEGIIIAEQIPTVLVKGAIGNTYIKIMHWLEDAPSFELFSNVTNLNQNQKTYARTLKPGFAIVRSMYGQPVHLKVPEFGDQDGYNPDRLKNLSDSFIRQRMIQKLTTLGLGEIETVPWNSAFNFVNQAEKQTKLIQTDSKLDQWVVIMPMHSCFYCPGRKDFSCKYRSTVKNNYFSNPGVANAISQKTRELLDAKTQEEIDSKINQLREWLVNKKEMDSESSLGLTYCVLANQIQLLRNEVYSDPVQNKRMMKLLSIVSSKGV
ncbi:MAG: ATP-binding protein [Anaerolineaceae bacterium]|nr:ATP-binding protein [Anaerolineaceae bacterium]